MPSTDVAVENKGGAPSGCQLEAVASSAKTIRLLLVDRFYSY